MSVAPIAQPDAGMRAGILEPLSRLRRRCRAYLALEGMVRFVLALMSACLVQLLIDRALKLDLDQRAAINVVITLFWLWIIHRHLVRPLSRPLADALLAQTVDRANPHLHDRIATAVQFASGAVGSKESNSPQLVRAVIDEACSTAAKVAFVDVLDHRRARQRSAELAGLVAAAVLAFVLLPNLMIPWFQRNWLARDIPWPQQTSIRPEGFDAFDEKRAPRGETLEIFALNLGRVPKSAVLDWRTPDGRGGSETMTLIGASRWVVSLGTLSEDVFFRIHGGDERTGEYHVVVDDRPRVVRTEARVEPPEYAGLDVIEYEQQAVLDLPAGSKLRIDAHLNKPVTTARFAGSGGVALDCEVVAADHIRVVWEQPRAGAYRFELIDANGWENIRPVRFTLKLIPDRAPAVQLELTDVGESITPSTELPLALDFKDEYGLGSAQLFAQRGDDPPLAVPLEGFEAGRREYRTALRYAVRGLGVQPEDRLRLWAEGRDQDPSGPNIGKSDVIELRVLAPIDLRAELAQRELELRQEFERLITSQRGVKDALERLSAELPADAPTRSQAQQLAGLSRRQESITARVLELREGFERILGQMRTSRISRAAEERRIGSQISDPLAKLGEETMPEAQARVSDLRQASDAERVDDANAAQADALREMGRILSGMKEFEGYREVLNLLEEIIGEQSELKKRTIKALEKQVGDILDLDDIDQSLPADRPKP